MNSMPLWKIKGNLCMHIVCTYLQYRCSDMDESKYVHYSTSGYTYHLYLQGHIISTYDCIQSLMLCKSVKKSMHNWYHHSLPRISIMQCIRQKQVDVCMLMMMRRNTSFISIIVLDISMINNVTKPKPSNTQQHTTTPDVLTITRMLMTVAFACTRVFDCRHLHTVHHC